MIMTTSRPDHAFLRRPGSGDAGGIVQTRRAAVTRFCLPTVTAESNLRRACVVSMCASTTVSALPDSLQICAAADLSGGWADWLWFFWGGIRQSVGKKNREETFVNEEK